MSSISFIASWIEAALMFNLSLFVLFHWNPGLLLGASCLLLCRDELKPRQGYDRGWVQDGEDLSNFHMSGVNSQSAKTNRSCHCLIIQTWCIYSSSTKESRPPCIMNHQVFGTVSRLDEVWTALHHLNKVSVWVFDSFVERFPTNINIKLKIWKLFLLEVKVESHSQDVE